MAWKGQHHTHYLPPNMPERYVDFATASNNQATAIVPVRATATSRSPSRGLVQSQSRKCPWPSAKPCRTSGGHLRRSLPSCSNSHLPPRANNMSCFALVGGLVGSFLACWQMRLLLKRSCLSRALTEKSQSLNTPKPPHPESPPARTPHCSRRASHGPFAAAEGCSAAIRQT